MTDTPDGCTTIHRLKKWSDGNLLEFNYSKCKVLHMRDHYRVGPD